MNQEKWPTGQQIPPQEEEKGYFDRLRKAIQGKVNESRLSNTDYQSTVGVYGGKLVLDSEGRLVYDTRGLVSKVDRSGDAVLRTYDEHLVKKPWELLKRHPRWFFRFLAPGPKRYRGTRQEIMENIERLGLTEYYGPHQNGIEIKKPEVYTKGVALQDIYRADLIDSDKLKEINRFEALASASQYISKIHTEHGGIGELVPGDIIFQDEKEGAAQNPVLNLPDIVYNKEKNIGEKEKKATDLLDFLASIGTEELRRSEDWQEVEKALKIILENYADQKVIALTASFARRGRLTLQGDTEILNLPNTFTKKKRFVFSQHNKARLGTKTNFEARLRQTIIEVCEKFKPNN